MPLIVSFDQRIALMQHWKGLIISIIVSSIPFLIWDIYFTQQEYWGFNDNYLLGIEVLGLPLEEVLFFICIPFACIFTHIAVLKIKTFRLSLTTTYFLSSLVIFVAFILLIFNLGNAYTVWDMTFIIIIQLIAIIYQKSILQHYFITFLFMLIPFFIVNGVLTGTGIDDNIVWYKDAETLALRILTIPVEDIFYAYSLILLNLICLETFSTIKSLHYTKQQDN